MSFRARQRLPRDQGKSESFMRQRSDYAAGQSVLIGDAQKLLENALTFVAEVKAVIDRSFSSLPSAE